MKRILFPALALILVVAGMSRLPAQSAPGVGQRFGAHDPRTCSSKKEPVSGAPSAAQATQYFICGNESYSRSFSTGESLSLVSDVKIEVGKGRAFNPVTDSIQNVDPSQMVYPIRGSYTNYICAAIGAINGTAGKNCMKGEGQNLGGTCYKDAFGDWHCNMCCILGSTLQTGNPPPGKP